MDFNRMCIYPKDVVMITGRTERYARNLLNEIRNEYSKAAHQFVSIEEFCTYTGLQIEKVQSKLFS